MRRPPRWMLVASLTLPGVVVVAATVLYVKGGARLARTWDVDVAALDIPRDEATVERGRHLADAVTICTSCHGGDLGGGVILDESMFATIYASNLTRGPGGVGSSYTDADFVRAIRHGVNREGRGLMIMHSDRYAALGRADLAAIIAYVKSVPPVGNDWPGTKGGPLGRVMLALGLLDSGVMPVIPAETIDHAAPVPMAPEPARTPEYGGYLVSIALCPMCHGPDLKGGPPIDAGAPPGPDITGYGVPGGWSVTQFVETIRTGTTPYGRALDPEFMPWEVFGRMTDDELIAIGLYLASLGG